MLLAMDVGNTQTVIGLFDGAELMANWRVSTNKGETADEMAVVVADLLNLAGLGLTDVTHVAVSSVVPHCTAALQEMSRLHMKAEALTVGPGVKTGLTILYDNPHEVGADRIVNAVAALGRHPEGAVVADFGTATTFDAVTGKREYLGGAICPGVEVSAEAMFKAAARLVSTDLTAPEQVIGRNTRASIQSGLIYGTAGEVDRIVEMMLEEMRVAGDASEPPAVIATGGLCELIAPHCRTITDVDPLLTLTGLRLVFDMNAA